MRVTQRRPNHRPLRRGGEGETGRVPTPESRLPKSDPRSPIPDPRWGFTLIELVIVILVLLILLTLTIAVVGNMRGFERVSGASRQIQNYFAGARDRAIYAASRQEDDASGSDFPPRVGVRFLSDPSLVVKNAAGENVYRGYTSMVFIQEIEPMPTTLRLYKIPPGNPNAGQWMASQFRYRDADGDGQNDEDVRPFEAELPMRSVGQLIQRGLIESRMERDADGNPVRAYYLNVYFDDDRSRQTYYVRFTKANLDPDPAGDPNVGYLRAGALSRSYANAGTKNSLPANCHIRLLPAPMPNEEPRLLPEGVVIDTQSSLLGSAPTAGSPAPAGLTLQNLSRADGSFDVMFNAQGVIDGPIAATGLVQLVVADLEDLERGYHLIEYNGAQIVTDSPYIDSDGDGTFDDGDNDGSPDERFADVRIVSVRAQTGGAYVSEINPVVNPDTGTYDDPYLYAESGGEAQ